MKSKKVESGELRVIVDKRGRTFERGAELAGKPGVVVEGVRRIGNYTTVRFGLARVSPKVPEPMVFHDDDLRCWE